MFPEKKKEGFRIIIDVILEVEQVAEFVRKQGSKKRFKSTNIDNFGAIGVDVWDFRVFF